MSVNVRCIEPSTPATKSGIIFRKDETTKAQKMIYYEFAGEKTNRGTRNGGGK